MPRMTRTASTTRNFELARETYFFKVDYYSPTCKVVPKNPPDPEKTTRVLTIIARRRILIPQPTERRPAMAGQQPAYRAYTVVKREGQETSGSRSVRRSRSQSGDGFM